MTDDMKELLAMPVEELMAALKPVIDPPIVDISSHPVCQSCRGLCCEQFMIGVVVDDATGLPDWDAQQKRITDVPASDFAFIREHFKPLRQPGDAVYDARTVQVAGLTKDHERQRHELWFTCTAFKGGRCSKYDQRPQVCRIHLCSPAKHWGINPELDIIRVSHCSTPYQYREIFPAMDGPGDTNFVKPGLDTKKRMEENDERRKRLNSEIPTRWPIAAKRAGITQTLDEFIDALEEANKVTQKAKP
jgi:Fe-S-cluster containining protein